jgi:hypothetical protein
LNNILFSLVLTLVAVGATFAQSTGKSDVAVGYQFTRQDVKFEQQTLAFDENTDSHGFYANGAYYPGKAGVVGITGDVGVSIDSNEANLVTAMGGLTLKARNNKYVQPYVMGLAGVARQHVNRQNIFDTTDVSLAYGAGAGVDIKFRSDSKVKLQVGANYLNTGFNDQRQNAVQLRAGLVF